MHQELDKERELEENMVKLEKEKATSDELLYSLIPKPIAERIKRGSKPLDTCEVRL